MHSDVGPGWQWLCLSYQCDFFLHWARLQEGKIKELLQIQLGARWSEIGDRPSARGQAWAATPCPIQVGRSVPASPGSTPTGSCPPPLSCYTIISQCPLSVQSLRGLGSVTRFLLSTNCFLSVLPTPRAPIPSCLPATQSPHHGVQGPPTFPSRGSTSKTKLSLPPATSSPAYGCRLLRHSSRRPSAVP